MLRRHMLQQLGLWGLGAPVLLHSRRSAAVGETPRRVVVIFSPNGPQHTKGPTEADGSEFDFQLHPWWSPLQRHKDRGVFFRGVHQAGVPFGDNSEYGHRSGTVGALTATTTGSDSNQATGPSIDQFIGQQLQASGVVTPKRSLLWSLSDNASAFYEAAGQRATPVFNPYEALVDIAPAFGGDSDALRAMLTRKHFALDHMATDCASLRSELDGTGREMLDFHCANIESLEASVKASLDGGLAACQMPEDSIISLPEDADWTGREARDAAMAAYTELMALAFTCDVTRVIGLSFGSGAARFSIPESYGVPSSGQVDSGDSGPQMHAWTHQSGNNPDTMLALEIFYNWFSEKVAAILDKLQNTPDVDGRPLLDTTLVLWTSEFGSGGPHTNANTPVILFGDSEGQIVTGRQFEIIDGPREEKALPVHNLFVSMIHHMGLTDIDTFGNAGQGPLEWLYG